jgi:hypothetical protein
MQDLMSYLILFKLKTSRQNFNTSELGDVPIVQTGGKFRAIFRFGTFVTKNLLNAKYS